VIRDLQGIARRPPSEKHIDLIRIAHLIEEMVFSRQGESRYGGYLGTFDW
jgi:hypothetical protein